MFPVEARGVGDDVQLLVDRRGVRHLVEPVPQAAGEVEPDVAAQQAGIDGEPRFPLPPSTCSWCSAASTARSPVAEVRVSAAVQAAASIPAGTGRPSATQSEVSVASRSRTSSPVLSTQLGAGTASRRIILPT